MNRAQRGDRGAQAHSLTVFVDMLNFKTFGRMVLVNFRVPYGTKGLKPYMAQVLGVLFNVMFLDHLAADVEHLERLNHLLQSGRINRSGLEGCETIHPLKPLLITPSVDLSQLAYQHQRDMPYLIHYFMNGLGRDAASCADLISYVLFSPKYTSELIDIGYKDADRRIDEIEEFLFGEDASAPPPRATRNGRVGVQ